VLDVGTWLELATCDLAFFGQPANFPDPNSCF
jgi:hypothetical protein